MSDEKEIEKKLYKLATAGLTLGLLSLVFSHFTDPIECEKDKQRLVSGPLGALSISCNNR